MLRGHSGSVPAVAVTPDGEEIITAGDDGTIRVWNRSSGHQVRGSDLGGIGTAKPLPGVRSDEPSDLDLLGIAAEVEMLATLVAAASTEAPLAVALLGDWGSGKSSFMRQMENHLRELASASVNNLGQSEFVANVCQVRFNAWHYSDEQIWTGLVEHLFRALSSGDGDSPLEPVTTAKTASEIGRQLKAAQADYAQVSGNLTRLANKSRPVGRLAGLGSARELLSLPGVLAGEIWRDVRSSWRSLLTWLLLAAALSAAAAGFVWARGILAPSLLALASVGVAAGKSWRSAKSVHAWLVDSAGRERRRLEERRDAAHRQIARLRGELALVSASERLRRFVEDRTGAEDYTPYRGLLGLVYRDLHKLNENLEAARQEWESLKTPRPVPPLQRIVLYIDDLDRCPPKRVVEVLAAVHLLLAMPLFVVVVAVDVRWLELSLKHHFSELMGRSDVSTEMAGMIVTPWDYLEKIFQITYALRPMGPQAGTYLRALLPEETEDSDVAAPSVQAESVITETEDSDVAALRTEVQTDAITPEVDNAVSGPRQEAETQNGRRAFDPKAQSRGPVSNEGKRAATKAEPSTVSMPARRVGSTLVRNLQPEGLRMRAREREFIPVLAPLLSTPRAAKRFINIYRLIRIGIAEEDLLAFVGDETGGPYQAMALLIAIVIGHSDSAHRVLSALRAASVPDFFRLLSDLNESALSATSEDWRRLLDQLDEVKKVQPNLVTDIAEYKRWAPTVARFSVHTRDLMGTS